MAGQPNLDAFVIRDWERRLRKLEAGAPMNNAAIGRSGMEVYDGGSINISNGSFYLNGYGSVAGTLAVSGTLPVTGGLIVSGTERITGSWFLDGVGQVAGTMTVTGGLIVDGTQRVSGTLEVTGDLIVKGPLDVTGPTKLDGKTDIGGNTTVTGDLDVEGPLDVTGTMDIKGKSTLQNDLDVRNGGSVKVGGMTLDPSRNGGSIQFINGAYLISNAGVTSLAGSGDAYVTLSADMAQIRGTKVALNGQLSNPNHATTSSDTKPNVYMDASGNIKRILPG